MVRTRRTRREGETRSGASLRELTPPFPVPPCPLPLRIDDAPRERTKRVHFSSLAPNHHLLPALLFFLSKGKTSLPLRRRPPSSSSSSPRPLLLPPNHNTTFSRAGAQHTNPFLSLLPFAPFSSLWRPSTSKRRALSLDNQPSSALSSLVALSLALIASDDFLPSPPTLLTQPQRYRPSSSPSTLGTQLSKQKNDLRIPSRRPSILLHFLLVSATLSVLGIKRSHSVPSTQLLLHHRQSSSLLFQLLLLLPSKSQHHPVLGRSRP